jgi:hypothetical protein
MRWPLIRFARCGRSGGARAAARARVWALTGEHAPDHCIDVETPLIIDTDATLITSHSDKELAAPTFNR